MEDNDIVEETHVPERRLTLKQQRFVVFYLGEAAGNGLKAARMAGYGGNDKTLYSIAAENLRKPAISEKIPNVRLKEPEITVTREHVQDFWMRMMKEAPRAGDKLKASELLARSMAMFVERRIITQTNTVVSEMTDVDLERIVAKSLGEKE